MTYDTAINFPERGLAALLPAIDRATCSLVRFDERLRSDPLAKGLRQRLDFAEAVGIAREDGDLIHLEDLVLRDAGLLGRVGDFALARALLTLKARRQAAKRSAAWVASDDGLACVTGTAREAGPEWTDARSQDLAPDPDAFARVRQWRRSLGHLDEVPPVLAAAMAWDRWVSAPPLPSQAGVGSLLVASYLRERALVQHHLPVLAIGLRVTSFRPLAQRSRDLRLAGFLNAMAAGAGYGMKELARLTTAREVMALKLAGRRKSSRLPALLDLLLARPLITIPMAARELRISQQAVAALLPQLGSTPRELTDRSSYRAWGI